MKTLAIRRAALGLALLAALAGPALAQSAENPLLVLTITGGWITGNRLWALPQQPEAGLNQAMDTVALERRFRTGLVMGLSATLFRSPHWGYTGELVYLGAATESRCAPPAQWSADPDSINKQACSDVQGRNLGTSIVGLLFGATWRATATGAAQPYLRAVVGPGYISGSFVQTDGTVFVPGDTLTSPLRIRTLLGEPQHRTWTWVAALSGGATMKMGPDMQLRFEVRDVVTNLPVVTGPGNPLVLGTPAQVSGKVFHLFSFVAGLDILLEQSSRPHRY